MREGWRRLVITILALAAASVSLVIGCVISVIYPILQPPPSTPLRQKTISGVWGEAGGQQQVEAEGRLGVT